MKNHKRRKNLMSALVDAMTALGAQVAALNATSNAPHLQAIDDHLAKIDAQETTDEATIADTKAALQAFVTSAKAVPDANTGSTVTAPGSAAAAS